MESKAPLFKEILAKNQIVKGRLQISVKDLNFLYKLILKESKKTEKKIKLQNKKIQSHIKKMSELKLALKRNNETIKKAFFPKNENISILYKKIGKQFYIKARIYWLGIQREVQVGTIEKVLNLIQEMQKCKKIDEFKIPIDKLLTWEQIKKNYHILESIKLIASIKFQEYIIRNIIKIYDYEIIPNDSVDIVDQIDVISDEFISEINSRSNTVSTDDLEQNTNDKPNRLHYEDGKDWYVRWRENNLK